MYKIFLLLSLQLIGSTILFAQEQADTAHDLFATIALEDSLLFDAIFTRHDSAYLASKLMEDFEFYHDKNGFTHQTASAFVADFQRIWNLQETGKKKEALREIIPESLRVYPLNNYGAVQLADHKFYELEADGSKKHMDDAKIVHLWKKEEDGWKLSRIISYDHVYIPSAIPQALEKKIKELMAAHKVPSVSIARIKNGEIRFTKTYGELKQGIPSDNQSIYKVASITKPLFATVVLQLVSEGKWSLDEPVYKYWIDEEVQRKTWLKQLTTRHILSHQSGFPNWRFQTESGKLELEFEPGDKFQYSGEGFEYLRKAIESKFDQPFEEIATERLFQPLNMKDTRFWWDDKLDESRYAVNHNKEGKPYKVEKYYDAMAAANLLTTIDDYAKFACYIANDKGGISDNIWRQMTTIHTPPTKSKKSIPLGLGWFVFDGLSNNEFVLFHDGGDPGVRTFVTIYPESKDGLVILMNSRNGDKIFEEVLSTLMPHGEEMLQIMDALQK